MTSQYGDAGDVNEQRNKMNEGNTKNRKFGHNE